MRTISLTEGQIEILKSAMEDRRYHLKRFNPSSSYTVEELEELDNIDVELSRTAPEIVIEISGGVYQGATSTVTLDVTVVDHDNIKVGDSNPLEGYRDAAHYLVTTHCIPPYRLVYN